MFCKLNWQKEGGNNTIWFWSSIDENPVPIEFPLPGLDEAIIQSISACRIDLQNKLLGNILLVGGVAKTNQIACALKSR